MRAAGYEFGRLPVYIKKIHESDSMYGARHVGNLKVQVLRHSFFLFLKSSDSECKL